MKKMMKTAFVCAFFAFASASPFATCRANDFFKVLDNINKGLETIQDASVQSVQVSSSFSSGAASGVGTVFTPDTKTIYVSYTAKGSSYDLPIQAVWSKISNGVASRIYTMSGKMPKSGSVAEFHLSSNGTWPLGDYKVDLIVQNKTAASASFKIDSSQSSGNAGVWNGTAVVEKAGVKDVVAAKGFASGKADGAASSFEELKTVYAVYTATGPSEGVEIQALWYSVDAKGAAVKIATLKGRMPASGSASEFHLSVSGSSWPVGSYRVDLLIDGAVAGSVSFKIDAPSNSGIWQTSGSVAGKTVQTAQEAGISVGDAVKTSSSSVESTVSKAQKDTSKALDDFFSK
jgi:hypothetical protein